MTDDAPIPQQLRGISLEILRERARKACERRSIRAVAAEMGLGRTTLHNFVNKGTTPHPRVRRLVALWFVAQPGDTEAEVDACEILLGALPATVRRRAEGDLIAFVRDLHRQYGGRACASSK